MKREKGTRTIGARGERLARWFLEQQGLHVLAQNYRFERGEIDLVCEEADELVFVEVKTRASTQFGDPEDAVTEAKQQQIRAAAGGYCYERDMDDRFCRFDIVAVELKPDREIVRHLRNAF